MAKSEFGRGYITCLFQYANHRKRMTSYLSSFKKIGQTDQHALELWANGASDHLYELRRPRRHIKQSEWGLAQAVQRQALDWGHGFRGTPITVALAEMSIATAVSLARQTLDRFGCPWPNSSEEAVEIDQKVLGIKSADSGTWSCSEDIEKF